MRWALALLSLILIIGLVTPLVAPQAQAQPLGEVRLDVYTKATVDWRQGALTLRIAGWEPSLTLETSGGTVSLSVTNLDMWAFTVADYSGRAVLWEDCQSMHPDWQVRSFNGACWLVGPSVEDRLYEAELRLSARQSARGYLVEARALVDGVEVAVIRFETKYSPFYAVLTARGAVEGVVPQRFYGPTEGIAVYSPFSLEFPFPKLPGRELEFRASVSGPSPDARVLSVDVADRGWYYLVTVTIDAPPVTMTETYWWQTCYTVTLPWTAYPECTLEPVVDIMQNSRYTVTVEAVDAQTGELVARLALDSGFEVAGGSARGGTAGGYALAVLLAAVFLSLVVAILGRGGGRG